MKKSFRNKVAIIMAFYVLFASMHLPYFKVYADEINANEKVSQSAIEFVENMQNEDVLKNNKSIGAVASLVPVAIPGLLKIMQVFMATLVFTDSWQNGLVGTVKNLLSNIVSGNYNDEIEGFFEKKLEQAQASTVAFLVAYDNFSTSTGKIVDSVRTKLLKYYQEDFLTTLESALAKGVSIATLTTYGVTKFFDLDIYNQVYNEIPNLVSFPMISGSDKGITNEGITVGYGLRYLTTNPTDSYNMTYNMMSGYDLAMQYVDKVQITRKNVEQYNYGHNGLCWTQQYYMKTAKDGLRYMIVFTIGKALSTNQRLDKKHDGLSFGLFQVNELGQIVTGNSNNVYYRSGDSRLNTYVPATGTNLYKGSTTGIDFGKLRSICVDLWGADVFPNVPDVWNLGTDCVSDRNRLVDYSKNEPGVYDNEWNYQGKPVFPIPGIDTPVRFPTLRPGDSISVPTLPNNPTWDNVFPPSTFPGVDVYNPGATVPDIPGDDVLNPDIPDVDVPETDVPGTDTPGTPSLSWDWLKTLLNKLLEFIQSILDWLGSFWDNLLQFLISLLVPAEGYWTNLFEGILENLKLKIPDIDIDVLEMLAVEEKTFEDVYANFFGVRCLVVRGSVINQIISWARPIIQGLIALFLLLYNYNQVYKLIRGGSLVGSSNTLDNMNNGRVGGK